MNAAPPDPPGSDGRGAIGRLAFYGRLLALALVAVHVAAFVFAVSRRIGHPFELEWLEGAALEHSRRVARGEPLYVEPSMRFVPSIYTPLYFQLGGLLLRTGLDGFAPLRAISLLASLGCLALIARWIFAETRSPFATALGAGLFVALHRAGGTFLDVARIDMVFVFFGLAGFAVVRAGPTPARAAASAVLLTLCYLTKQTAIAFVPAMFLHLLVAAPRSAGVFAVVAAALLGGSTLALDRAHDGWYVFYVHGLLVAQPIDFKYLVRFWSRDVLGTCGIAFVVGAAWLYGRFAEREADWKRATLPLAFGGSFAAAAWISRLHVGGYDNVLIPLFAATSVLFGLGVARFETILRDAHGGRWAPLLPWLCALQFHALLHDPREIVPTRADVEAGRAVVERIAAIEGDVFVPSHPYLAVMAGKPTHIHGLTIDDLIRGRAGEARDAVLADFERALDERRYAAIVADESPIPWMGLRRLRGRYRLAEEIRYDGREFFPVVGWPTRPRHVYVPMDEDGEEGTGADLR